MLVISECCLIELLPYILFEKYINILELEMASPGNLHCANCIGTLSFSSARIYGDIPLRCLLFILISRHCFQHLLNFVFLPRDAMHPRY